MMKKSIVIGLVLASSLSSGVVAAATNLSAAQWPKTGFGFDWLQGEDAQCRTIDAKLFAQFASCNSDGGFGRATPSATCLLKKSAKSRAESEWMIYSKRKDCVTELETMKANAP